MKDIFIYLDHAAATPIDPRVLDEMKPYFSTKFFNPSSPYAPAVILRREYEEIKHRIAMSIGGRGTDIIMTAGATESINIIMNSISGHIVTTEIEHPAVLQAVAKHDHTLVSPDKNGMINPADIAKAIRHDTELVSVQLANNEIGTIQSLREISEVIRAERTRRMENGEKRPIYLHSDASQGLGQIDVHVARLGVDALTLNAGKIYGPKQVGCLWVDRYVKLSPYIYGGGQERGIRSGTENVAGASGFAKAIELAQEHRSSESKRLAILRDKLETSLMKEFPDAIVSGSRKKRLPGHLHISFPGLDAERLIFLLEAKGVYVATGSACSANKGTRSHVLDAIGLDPEVSDGSLRITLGRLNNDKNIDEAKNTIIDVVRSEYERISS